MKNFSFSKLFPCVKVEEFNVATGYIPGSDEGLQQGKI